MRARFRERSERDLARLRELRAEHADTPELRGLIHNLAGAAGTFGYPALSAAAAVVDDCYAEGREPDAALFDALELSLTTVLSAE